MVRFLKVNCCIFLLFFGDAVSLSAEGQVDSETKERAELLNDAAQRSWRLDIRPAFVKARENQEGNRETIENVDLRFEPYSDLNAFSSPRKIIVPYGMLLTLDIIVDGYLTAGALGPDFLRKMPDYMQYVIGQYGKARNGNVLPIFSFWKWAGIDLSKVKTITQQSGYGDKKAGMMEACLAFILGHELGHIIMKHPPYRSITFSQSQQNEYDADNFGDKIASDAGYLPIVGYGVVLPLFALLEGSGPSDIRHATHPPAVCRIARLARRDLPRIDTDPSAPQALAKVGMSLEKWGDLITDLQSECVRLEQAG